jgi:hypothetical protein
MNFGGNRSSLGGLPPSNLTHPLAIHTPNLTCITPNHKIWTQIARRLHKLPTTKQLGGATNPMMHDAGMQRQKARTVAQFQHVVMTVRR